MSANSNRPSSKLTSTMLTQIEENEYLRIKLIQLEKVSREKDNFYLSIFREQQKITEKVMSQLLLAEQRIKQFVRQRICNNWKDEYDNLAENINSYINDVNGLIGQYQHTKKGLQQKAYNNNDLYEYYSNTLQECGKKFDQAQIIIEELNNKVQDLKQTIIELDDDLGQKINIIEEQRNEIFDLRDELNNQSQLQFFKEAHQSDIRTNQSLKKTIKKLEKHNEALERSNQELGRLVNQLRKQQDQDKLKRQALQEDLSKLQLSIQTLNQKIIENEKNKAKLQAKQKQQAKQKERQQENQKKSDKRRIFRKGDVQFVSMFHSNNNPINVQQNENEQRLVNENQLHLRKMLEQQEIINGLSMQLNYNKKSLESLESQNKKLIQFQIQYINMENSYKRQFSELKQKIISLSEEVEYKSQQINGLQLERTSFNEEDQDIRIQVQGLHQQIARLKQSCVDLEKKLQMNKKENDFLLKNNQEHQENIQILQQQKQQSKTHFQTLLQQFQQFVKESEYQKELEIQQKKEALNICSFQVNQNFTVFKTKIVTTPSSSSEYSKMKKKNLLINLDEHQTLKQRQGPKDVNTQTQKQTNLPGTTKNKKFNLQTFQQKTNPQINICWSPKVGDIYNAVHQGRLNGTHRW